MKVTLILATLGVVITSLITGISFAFISNWDIKTALLLGAIISSTDAAAVFSILRTKSIKKDISSVTEIESAANDPMAILLTIFLLSIISGEKINIGFAVINVIWQLLSGIALGITFGKIFSYLFNKIKKLIQGITIYLL